MVVDLTKPEKLPEEFVAKLKGLKRLCDRFEFSEELVEQREVKKLVRDIDTFCLTQKIVGVHYTRSVPESIRRNGLLVRDGSKIRTDFLNEHGHIFTELERVEINKRWGQYFQLDQSEVRDGRVFFNFTESALNTFGTESLLGLYGGEQVSMCFDLDEAIGEKLNSIGKPLVVRCALDPNALHTFTEYPWGKILVSSFHLAVNPEAYRIDQDGYQTLPVEPKDVIEIRVIADHKVHR